MILIIMDWNNEWRNAVVTTPDDRFTLLKSGCIMQNQQMNMVVYEDLNNNNRIDMPFQLCLVQTLFITHTTFRWYAIIYLRLRYIIYLEN